MNNIVPNNSNDDFKKTSICLKHNVANINLIEFISVLIILFQWI